MRNLHLDRISPFFILFSTLSFAATNTDSIVQQLESAATTCNGGCVTTCSEQADAVRKISAVSGNEKFLKQSIMTCYSSLVRNPANASNPVMVQLIMTAASPDLNTASTGTNTTSGNSRPNSNAVSDFKANSQKSLKAAIDKQTANTTTTSVAHRPVDTNFRDQDGRFNIDKVVSIYEATVPYCASLNSNSTMRSICQQGCRQKVQQLKNAVSNEDGNALKNYVFTDLGCLSSLKSTLQQQGKNPSDDPIITALTDAGAAVKANEWPPKKKLSLDLELAELTAVEKDDQTLARVTAKDATTNLTFDAAQSQLKTLSDYSRLESKAREQDYSLDQLRQAMSRLRQQQNKVDPAKWQAKAYEISDAGIAKELYDAINQPCDRSYLETFNQPGEWKSRPVDSIYGDHRPPMEQRLSSLYLHRLCFTRLIDSITPELATASNSSEFNQIANKYLSKPPQIGVSKVMSDRLWLPNWHRYLATRSGDLQQGDKKNSLAIAQQNQQLANKQRQIKQQQVALQNSQQLLINYQKSVKDQGSNGALSPTSQLHQTATTFFVAAASNAEYFLQTADKNLLLISSEQGLTAAKVISRPKDMPEQTGLFINHIRCQAMPGFMRIQPINMDSQQLIAMTHAAGACFSTFFDLLPLKNLGAGRTWLQVTMDLKRSAQKLTVEQLGTAYIEKQNAMLDRFKNNINQLGYTQFNYTDLYNAYYFLGKLNSLNKSINTQNTFNWANSNDFFMPMAEKRFASIIGVQHSQSATLAQDARAQKNAQAQKVKQDIETKKQARIAAKKQAYVDNRNAIDAQSKPLGLPSLPYQFNNNEMQKIESMITSNGSCPSLQALLKASTNLSNRILAYSVCGPTITQNKRKVFMDFLRIYQNEFNLSGKKQQSL